MTKLQFINEKRSLLTHAIMYRIMRTMQMNNAQTKRLDSKTSSTIIVNSINQNVNGVN